MVGALPDNSRPLRRAEYEQLVALGAFGDERIELLDGVLVPMSPIGTRHASAVDLLTVILIRALGDRARVRVQGPFAVSDISEPEPDLLVAPMDDYVTDHPTEAYLVIEVADSTLAKDRTTKLCIYAEHGVPEYWIVDVTTRRLCVYRDPSADGFKSSRVFEHHEAVELLRFPDVRVNVADVLK